MINQTTLFTRFLRLLGLLCAIPLGVSSVCAGQDGSSADGIDAKIDSFLEPVSVWAGDIVFYSVPIAGQSVPVVLILLAGTAIFLTFYFKFINVRAFGLALRTVKGRYTGPKAEGQITHFQALSAALSATVGLGNIAGVAVAIGLGGPGATFWMILMGIFGMTTKFCECTLGVRYRRIDAEGKVHGGAMYYLKQGFSDKGFPNLGRILAVFFALMCIGGAFGAGNMFQVNQAHDQFARTFNVLHEGWQFGLLLGIMCGMVIIGGIVWIARVTSFLVPFMCVSYIIAALVIIIGNIEALPGAFAVIIKGAFSPEAVGGGTIGGIIVVMIQGVKRAAFSNEAGLGSAPIAHAAVKTEKPASEGLVALLEPFVDTVVVCTMTALVIITTGMWNVNADVENNPAALVAQPEAGAEVVASLEPGSMIHIVSREPVKIPEWYEVTVKDSDQKGWVAAESITLREGWGGGIWLTSKAFGSVISWFPIVLAAAVFLFAFSTMISWSYYGQQAVVFLFGPEHRVAIGVYKVIFCLVAILGGAASLKSVLNLSDAMVFAMVLPNLIGVYFLLPVVKKELASFRQHVADVEGK